MQRGQRGGHAEPKQQFQVFDVRDPVRIEPIGQAAHERGIVAPGQRQRQPVRGEGGQRKGGEKGQVVGGDRAETEPL